MPAQENLAVTASQRFRRVRTVNATDNGYPSKVPTTTEPVNGQGTTAAQATTAAVIDCALGGNVSQNGVLVLPYGAGADDTTFSMRVVGWRYLTENASPETGLWVPVDLCEVQCTLSTEVGVAGTLLLATDRLCDIITLTGTTANANVGIEIVSPANNRAGYFILDFKGFQKIEFIFTTGASATSGNALVALL